MLVLFRAFGYGARTRAAGKYDLDGVLDELRVACSGRSWSPELALFQTILLSLAAPPSATETHTLFFYLLFSLLLCCITPPSKLNI